MKYKYERVVTSSIQITILILSIDNNLGMWQQYSVAQCQQDQNTHTLALKICESINPQRIIEIEVNSAQDQSLKMFMEIVKVNKDILISSSASFLQMFYSISFGQIKVFSKELRIYQTINEIKSYREQQKQKAIQKTKFINKDSLYKTSFFEINRLKGIIFDKDKKIKQLEKKNNQLNQINLRLINIQDLSKKTQEKLQKELLQHENSKKTITELQNLIFSINRQKRQRNCLHSKDKSQLTDDIIKENRWYEDQLQIKSNKIKKLELQIHQLRKGFNNRSNHTMG